MTASRFADLPDGPCYAVIFSSLRTPGDSGYAATAERMEELVAEQPGFLGMESVRGEDGFGITVGYFESEEAVAAWKAHAEHREAQRLGRGTWYERFEIRIARVERAYGFNASQGGLESS